MDLTPPARALRDFMSELSEAHYSAGWLIHLEYRLWSVLQGNPSSFARGGLTASEVQQLRDLSAACGGWIYVDDAPSSIFLSESFIPLDAWLARFASHSEGRC